MAFAGAYHHLEAMTDQLQLEELFRSWNLSEDQSRLMARQLLRRASQLESEGRMTRVEAVRHFLSLMIEARESVGGPHPP